MHALLTSSPSLVSFLSPKPVLLYLVLRSFRAFPDSLSAAYGACIAMRSAVSCCLVAPACGALYAMGGSRRSPAIARASTGRT